MSEKHEVTGSSPVLGTNETASHVLAVLIMGRSHSGLVRGTGNAVGCKPSRVQISLSPPNYPLHESCRGLLYANSWSFGHTSSRAFGRPNGRPYHRTIQIYPGARTDAQNMMAFDVGFYRYAHITYNVAHHHRSIQRFICNCTVCLIIRRWSGVC